MTKVELQTLVKVGRRREQVWSHWKKGHVQIQGAEKYPLELCRGDKRQVEDLPTSWGWRSWMLSSFQLFKVNE